MAPIVRVENVVIGFVLVSVGVLWTLANLGRLELLPALRTWWPATLIVWGAFELLNTLLSRASRRPE